MRIWSVIFTSPAAPWQSARVAAPDRGRAALVLAADGISLTADAIVAPMGEISAEAPTLLSYVDRAGTVHGSP